MSKRVVYVPDVTPNGNPGSVPGVSTTPAVPVNGLAMAPWICAAVVVPSRPLKFTLMDNVRATLSYAIEPPPVPGEAFTGDSLSPLKDTEYKNTDALAVIRPLINKTDRIIFFMIFDTKVLYRALSMHKQGFN